MSMFRNITIGQYLPGDSILHRLDARSKLISLVFWIIAIFIVNSYRGYLFLAVVVLILLFVSALPLKYILRGLRPVYYIMAFTFIIHLFFTKGGAVLIRIGPVTVESYGIYLGFFMVLRIIFLIVISSLLTLTTSPITLTDALEYLMGPLRKVGVPANEIAMMMTIALRFIPTLMEESEKIMKAQMARGADFESGNFLRRAKGLVPLLVPLFVSSFRRADDLAVAMEARCYRGGEGRTRLRELQAAPRDFFAVAASAALIAILICFRL